MKKVSAVGSRVPSIIALLSILVMVAIAVVGLCIGLAEPKPEEENLPNGPDIDAVDMGDGNISLSPEPSGELIYNDGKNEIQLKPQK